MTENAGLGPDLIETTDEEGNVHLFEKVEEYELDGKRYALLIYQGEGDEDDDAEDDEQPDESAHVHGPGCAHGHTHNHDHDHDEDDDESDDVILMRIATEDGADVFETIEDEDEFNRVVKHIEETGFGEDSDLSLDLSQVERKD